ncbi:hypothetical protein AAMO2058_001138800 [Amorphochlora amoebiformis]
MNLILFLLEELKKAKELQGKGSKVDAKDKQGQCQPTAIKRHQLDGVVAPLVRQTAARLDAEIKGDGKGVDVGFKVGDIVYSRMTTGPKAKFANQPGKVTQILEEWGRPWCFIHFPGQRKPFKFALSEVSRSPVTTANQSRTPVTPTDPSRTTVAPLSLTKSPKERRKEEEGEKERAAATASQDAQALPEWARRPDAFLGVEVRLHPGDARTEHVKKIIKTEKGGTLRVGLIGGGVGYAKVQWEQTVSKSSNAGIDAKSVPKKKNKDIKPSGATLVVIFGRLDPGAVLPGVHILLAHPRPRVLGKLWAVFAQLGVKSIIIINAKKVEKQYWYSDKSCVKPHLRLPLLAEGLQQGGHTRLPKVSVERFFRPFVEEKLDYLLPQNATRLLCDLGNHPTIRDVVASCKEGSPEIVLAIGAEGGWSQYEVDTLKEKGFKSVSLGPVIMRCDVACISAIAIATDQLVHLDREAQRSSGNAHALQSGVGSAAVDKRGLKDLDGRATATVDKRRRVL